MPQDIPYESVSKAENATIPAKELPTDEPLVTLEPVAYFNGAMPTGVTVSQKGRIFVNFPSGAMMSHSQSLKFSMVKQ